MRDAKGRFTEARAFQVGDRVKVLPSAKFTFRHGKQGEVVFDDGDPEEHGPYTVRFNDGESESGFNGSELEPAPQPKAEEGKPGAHLLARMVDRFLGWKLPEDFAPDCGISFEPVFNRGTTPPMRFEPTGTNLFGATQAKAMLEHVAGPALAELQGAVDSTNETIIKHQALLHDARQEIATLKAEVERLSKALHEEMATGAGIESARLVLLRKSLDAEAKLSDIKAIIRTFKILSDLPGEPGFADAVNAVLDGAA